VSQLARTDGSEDWPGRGVRACVFWGVWTTREKLKRKIESSVALRFYQEEGGGW